LATVIHLPTVREEVKGGGGRRRKKNVPVGSQGRKNGRKEARGVGKKCKVEKHGTGTVLRQSLIFGAGREGKGNGTT